jgi:hypothetical protein
MDTEGTQEAPRRSSAESLDSNSHLTALKSVLILSSHTPKYKSLHH